MKIMFSIILSPKLFQQQATRWNFSVSFLIDVWCAVLCQTSNHSFTNKPSPNGQSKHTQVKFWWWMRWIQQLSHFQFSPLIQDAFHVVSNRALDMVLVVVSWVLTKKTIKPTQLTKIEQKGCSCDARLSHYFFWWGKNKPKHKVLSELCFIFASCCKKQISRNCILFPKCSKEYVVFVFSETIEKSFHTSYLVLADSMFCLWSTSVAKVFRVMWRAFTGEQSNNKTKTIRQAFPPCFEKVEVQN